MKYLPLPEPKACFCGKVHTHATDDFMGNDIGLWFRCDSCREVLVVADYADWYFEHTDQILDNALEQILRVTA